MTIRSPLITPVRGATNLVNLTIAAVTPLSLVFAVAVGAAVGTATLEIPVRRPASSAPQEFIPPNLLESTLVGVAPPQPKVSPYLEPRTVARSAVASQVPFYSNVLPTLASGAATDKFSSTYWGNQYGAGARDLSYNAQNFLILGFPAPASPFAAMDYPNPVRRVPTIFADSEGSTNLLAGIPAGVSPKIPVEFPNPTLRRSTIVSDYQGSFVLLKGIPSGTPFAAMDYPNPSLRPSVPPDTSNVSYALLNTPLPVGQDTFPTDTFIRYVPRTAYFDGRNAFFPPPSVTPTPGTGTGQYGDRVILPAKKLGEAVNVPIDFISKLGPGEAILTAICTCTVYTGSDPSPASMVSGAANISGTIVTQLMTGGVLGTIYELLAKVTTSAGQTLELPGFLAVIPDLP